MYQQEFENLLRKNPPKAVLFYGENSYLISSYIKYYINFTNSRGNYREYYFDEYDFESINSYLSQNSLFGEANLLILKMDKKIPKLELKALLKLVLKSRSNYLIFEYLGATKDARSLHRYFSQNGAVWVRFFKPNIDEVISILSKEAIRINLNIDYPTLHYLAMTLSGDLALSVNELSKLSILDKKITNLDIDRLVYSTATFGMEQFLVELFNGEPIEKILNRLLEMGESEFSILRSTQIFLNQIFLFFSYHQLHGKIDSKAILGYQLPKDVMSARVSIALKLNLESILKIYELLLESEILIKQSSPNSREALLYGLFIRLQSYLSST